eukprot:TRINITY_DN2141_c0_g1_i3.p1 TRINITY_DN2141_c0_g1~~TRINITY_DN2141_c0_g1_i3.p1  ORF type:complete len:858 (-),score=126.05 TRINITY_DN2141_c0_g1_i3:47-2620(-)
MYRVFCLIALLCALATSDPDPGPGVVTMYFNTNWQTPYMHYNNGRGWTKPPGDVMAVSSNSQFPPPNWFVKSVFANQLTFLFNDGHGNWIHGPDGGNWQLNSPGIYYVKNGNLVQVQVFPFGCGGTCENGGVCNNATYSCDCKSGYFGPLCDGVCPGGASNPCNGHGKCNDGSNGDGSCVCTPPWATCGSSSVCSINTNSDPNNCGGCNSPCKVVPGVKSATCSNGACNLVCDQGWTLCYGTCQLGSQCSKPPLPGCQTFSNNQCSGNNINTPPEYEASRWWTPQPTDQSYLPSYGDYWRLVGHAHVVYSSSRTSATVQLVPLHQNSSVTFRYVFNGAMYPTDTMKFDTSFTTPLKTSILGSDGSKLDLADIDFSWNAPTIVKTAGDYRNGQKGAIVEMFGWPHADIEAECASLGAAGWLGVKVFPAQEQVMSTQPFNGDLNPWYFMYQPVSYRLEGRMGTRDDLRQMIYTCRKYGVRVYADAVINHMVGGGNDANPNHRNSNGGGCTNWGNKSTSSQSPSPFYTQDFAYTYNPHNDQPPSQEFPAVPYGPLDFHCERPLNSWTDPLDLNAGWLEGLVDLNTETDYVQGRIADYMTDLIGIGFSGFRVDAAKHINPNDLVAIFSKLRQNLGGSFPDDFITWWEILLGGESELLMCNPNSGYNYGQYVHDQFAAAGFPESEIDKIKIWNSGYPKEPENGYCTITLNRNVVQNDDADQQTQGSTSRDMGDQGTVLVIAKNIDLHRYFEMKLFQNPNGVNNNDNDYPIRTVLSSYYFPENNSRGVPDGLSDCSLCQVTCEGCQSVTYVKAFDPNSCGYDLPQFNQYTRVHRDKQIIMAMRQWMHLPTDVSNSQIGLPANC